VIGLNSSYPTLISYAAYLIQEGIPDLENVLSVAIKSIRADINSRFKKLEQQAEGTLYASPESNRSVDK